MDSAAKLAFVTMATYAKIFSFAFMMISSVVISSGKSDIDVAIDEMERANYFTFVMLMNMVPPNLFQGNVTFLMPSDRSLSRSMILQNSVEALLLRHSIPSPLLFDHLLHFPTNSILPTSDPDLMLKVSNSGRRGFFLGNVRIVTPNICTHGYSVRCHGVDGVLSIDVQKPSPIACSSSAAPSLAPPNLAPPPHYETSGGGRPQLRLSLTCIIITFVWVALGLA
ncbi:putative FAS1 domain-containing protein [Helianthus annuus]|uniref:FAS1 domain-containing protein n=2 Tax=Helianthus annuus TaxID=4232 RepID=A0A251SP06_HELAN|nr:putative FAS1 domain-containing protein [Helianthus annuus]KAJ0466309.1 putative FAS1 domain-containing protein [Helianthus annuus]KAJ0487873.1 putative FAS1 domain-containing protein [Helianthus annuus]KAJ0658344.1 putative FAS1 domain-containing protein [Helianthus annuus]KAJ0662004.1 putative FAS1 domain-containing protein [Helianthus annuus]